MKPLTDFLPEVLPLVQGCPQPVVVNAIRNSVIEFVGSTGVLEQTVDFALEPGVPEYTIDCETGTVPVSFVRGILNGQPVSPSSPASLEQKTALWDVETGQPVHAFIRNGLLVVAPIPTEAAVLTAAFTSTYARSALRVHDFVLEDWIEAVAHGALHRLMVLPGPWANPEMSAAYKSLFTSECDKGRIQRFKGSSEQSMRVSPRRFI